MVTTLESYELVIKAPQPAEGWLGGEGTKFTEIVFKKCVCVFRNMGEASFYRLSELPSFIGVYATEKQWHTPSRLPEIVYLLELKGGVSCIYMNENVGLPWAGGIAWYCMHSAWFLEVAQHQPVNILLKMEFFLLLQLFKHTLLNIFNRL